MTKKQIESKISKYLSKANRHKSTQAKLEKINELIRILQTAFAHDSNGGGVSPEISKTKEKRDELLAMYIELCHIHKIKFQMDALFAGVTKKLTLLAHNPEQMNQDSFTDLIQRLQTVLEIDPHHPEARALLNTLIDEYPEYAEIPDSSRTYLNILPYQRPALRIEIQCKHADIEKISALESLYASYQAESRRPGQAAQETVPDVCQLQFSLDQLGTFEKFHEALRTKPTYKIMVNNQIIEERFFSEWFQCYKRFLKAKNSQYCYGASPFTFNFFGCHKLYMKDVARQLGKCWFQYGNLDQESGLFLVDGVQIANQIRPHLPHCGFCPALKQEKLLVGMALIPKYLNPECDSRWKYFYANGKRVGVVPSGNVIVISTEDNHADHGESPSSAPSSTLRTETLIELGPTPYIEKSLRYLQANDIFELSETIYRNLSHCSNCGAVYKPHKMICSKCKASFGKYALKDLKNVLADLRDTKPINIAPVLQNLSTQDTGEFLKDSELQRKSVSFTQLWNDPEVREILLKKQETPHEEQDTKEEDQRTIHDHPLYSEPETSFASPSEASRSKPLSSGRFDLHEKLRGLVSKKYRERKAIEKAFSVPKPASSASAAQMRENESESSFLRREQDQIKSQQPDSVVEGQDATSERSKNEELLDAVKKLKPRQRSKLSKRGVVRVIYHATMDKETCPLCEYLDGMVMDPDDPATDIFSPPLYPGCTCSREYVLKTEKPKNWPKVTFKFPPRELLVYLKR